MIKPLDYNDLKASGGEIQRHWVDSGIIQHKPMIKDLKMLDEIILVECLNASDSIDSVFILVYTDDIKKLVFKLCDRYSNAIGRFKESKRRAKFSDFVKLDYTKGIK